MNSKEYKFFPKELKNALEYLFKKNLEHNYPEMGFARTFIQYGISHFKDPRKLKKFYKEQIQFLKQELVYIKDKDIFDDIYESIERLKIEVEKLMKPKKQIIIQKHKKTKIIKRKHKIRNRLKNARSWKHVK